MWVLVGVKELLLTLLSWKYGFGFVEKCFQNEFTDSYEILWDGTQVALIYSKGVTLEKKTVLIVFEICIWGPIDLDCFSFPREKYKLQLSLCFSDLREVTCFTYLPNSLGEST